MRRRRSSGPIMEARRQALGLSNPSANPRFRSYGGGSNTFLASSGQRNPYGWPWGYSSYYPYGRPWVAPTQPYSVQQTPAGYSTTVGHGPGGPVLFPGPYESPEVAQTVASAYIASRGGLPIANPFSAMQIAQQMAARPLAAPRPTAFYPPSWYYSWMPCPPEGEC